MSIKNRRAFIAMQYVPSGLLYGTGDARWNGSLGMNAREQDISSSLHIMGNHVSEYGSISWPFGWAFMSVFLLVC